MNEEICQACGKIIEWTTRFLSKILGIKILKDEKS
jgi:hypothetical protein